MKITGLKVKDVVGLENGFTSVVLEDGTQIISKIIIPGKGAAAAEPEDDDDEKPKAKKEAAKKPEPEPESLNWEDLKGMDEDELKDLIDDESLDTDPDDYDDDLPGLRKAIAKEMEIDIPKKK